MNSKYKFPIIILLIVIIAVYSYFLGQISFYVFKSYQKGWDWQNWMRLFSDISISNTSNYFSVHNQYIVYLFFPFYILFDRAGVYLFFIEVIILSSIAVYYYLFSFQLLKSYLLSFLLFIFFLVNFIFFEFIIRDFYLDFYLLIIPVLYYISIKKYNTAIIFLAVLLLVREDSYFISLMSVIYLFFQKKYRYSIIFFLIIFFVAISFYFTSKIIIGVKAPIYNSEKEIIIGHEDMDFSDYKNPIAGVYSNFGDNLPDIIKNAISKPNLVIRQLISKHNLQLIINLFSNIYFIALLNIKAMVLYFFIPYSYAFFSADSSSLRTFSHYFGYYSGIYITLLFALVFIKSFFKKYKMRLLKNKNIHFGKILLSIIVILIIIKQIKPITAKIQTLYNPENNEMFNTRLFDDLKKNKDKINIYINQIKNTIPPDEVIISTERLHYFINNTDNSFTFWMNDIIISDDSAFLAVRNKRLPVYSFFMDYSFDAQKGNGDMLLENIKKLIAKNKYEILYDNYPLFIVKKIR